MNLKSLFNRKYFVQNILKSKSILALVLSIVPILNAIFLLSLTKSEDSTVSSLNVISILNIIGMYIFPIVISLCLLGYVFNKKSTDFVNSMPLTRSQIFITNTIGGIAICVLMMIINTLVLALESLVIPNLAITFKVLLDYFIVWTVAYIFVFTLTNVAISVSGNMITSIVVVALLLFLVPFMHFYITGFNGLLGDITPELIARNATYERKIYEVKNISTYTLPFNYFTALFTNKIETYNIISIIKMLVLSIVYIFLGTYLFKKRKMEINETSFKSSNIHMLVKSLTMIPIVTFYLFIKEGTSNISIDIFFFVLLIIYSIIYDLITSKNIRNIKLGIVYFVITLVLCFGMYNLVKKLYNESRNISDFDISSIDQVALNVKDIGYIKTYDERYIYTDDENIVNKVKELISKEDGGSSRIEVRIKANKKEYETILYLDYENYSNLFNTYLENTDVIKKYTNINYDELLAIKVGDTLVQEDKRQELIDKLKEALIKNNTNIQKNVVEDLGKITISIYHNHKEERYTILSNIDDSLQEEYIKINNDKVLKKINNKGIAIINGIYKYSNGKIEMSSTGVGNLNELSQIIKSNSTNFVDVNKDIIVIYGLTEDFYNFTFFVNETKEIENIILQATYTGGGDYE